MVKPMPDIPLDPLVANSLLPHGLCLNWKPALLALHVMSDGIIALSYFSIPFGLAYFVSQRKDLEYRWMFILFAAFILACGTTHLFDIWTLWHPDYFAQGLIKAATAGISLATAILLWPVLQQALTLPSPRQLSLINADLESEITRRRETVLKLEQEAMERRQLELKLRQNEARLMTVLDTTVEGILTVSPSGIIETANAAASRMFGRRSGQLEGLPAETIIRAAEGKQGPILLSHLAQSADTPGGVKQSEFVGIRRQGETFPIDISVGKTRHGEPQFTCVLRDMTEQRKTEEQLRQNERQLKQQETELLHMQRLSTVGELAAMMAHEINQPLGAIVNYLGGITLRFEPVLNDHPPLREAVAESARLANRTSHIVQSIRNLVRRRDDERELLDMAALVQETASLLKQEMDRHHIQLQNDLPDSLPPIEGERVKLQQLLLNLILNAIEALAPIEQLPRIIRIQAPDTVSDDTLEICISDNGIGLSPDRLTRIFDPFVTSKSDGVGLGLSICKSIIESHGGEIAVTESGPGGSTFSIRLPKKRQQGAA